MSNWLRYAWLTLLVAVVLAAGLIAINSIRKSGELDSASGNLSDLATQSRFGNIYDTDFTKTSIDLDLLLSGGVGKDGIPALTNPQFEPIASSSIDRETLGIYIEMNGEERFYPYNILVWHEIVNDQIAGQKVAITFCPLCGSAVAYDPIIDGEALEFGVSGLLYESNLVMYDRTTESFWSQSIGESIVGEHLGTKLVILPFQLITLEQAMGRHPNTLIMTTDTGHNRNYDRTPYGDYNESEELFFSVSNKDARYHPKEIFYIVRKGGSTVAIRKDSFEFNKEFINDDVGVTMINNDGEITVRNEQGDLIPGYYEMWFSWVNQNPEGAVVWDPEVDS